MEVNAREAKEIIETGNACDGALDRKELAAYMKAKGFLEAVDKFKLVVEKYTGHNTFCDQYADEDGDCGCGFLKAWESYKRDVLGEKE